MSRKDYMPKKESVLHPWGKNLVKVTGARGTQWQIPAAATQKLSTSFNFYDGKYQIALDPATRTPAAVQDKNDAKKTFIGDARIYCKSYLLYNQLLTNADRDLLQLIHVVDTKEEHPRGGLPDDVAGFEKYEENFFFYFFFFL